MTDSFYNVIFNWFTYKQFVSTIYFQKLMFSDRFTNEQSISKSVLSKLVFLIGSPMNNLVLNWSFQNLCFLIDPSLMVHYWLTTWKYILLIVFSYMCSFMWWCVASYTHINDNKKKVLQGWLVNDDAILYVVCVRFHQFWHFTLFWKGSNQEFHLLHRYVESYFLMWFYAYFIRCVIES